MEGTVERGGEKLLQQPLEEFTFRSKKKGSLEEEKVGTMTESVNREEETRWVTAMSC